jgi:hypothetical protein
MYAPTKVLYARAFYPYLQKYSTMTNKGSNNAKVRLLQPDISAEMGCDLSHPNEGTSCRYSNLISHTYSA